MPTADPAAQRALLDLAEVDRAADAAIARRDGLPEHAIITENTAKLDELRAAVVLAATDVADLDSASRKLDTDIEGVRARAERDRDLLTSGAVSAKETENLTRELESLARRQSTLEDEALELMQQREDAGERHRALQRELDDVAEHLATATEQRDTALATIESELADLAADRISLTATIPAAVLSIYDRQRERGQIGAAQLSGSTCAACQMILDRASVEEITAAPADRVVTWPECGALLVRAASLA